MEFCFSKLRSPRRISSLAQREGVAAQFRGGRVGRARRGLPPRPPGGSRAPAVQGHDQLSKVQLN